MECLQGEVLEASLINVQAAKNVKDSGLLAAAEIIGRKPEELCNHVPPDQSIIILKYCCYIQ